MSEQSKHKTQYIGDQLFFYGCCLMAFLLPLHKVYTTIALVIILLGALLGTKNNIQTISRRYGILAAVFIGMYLSLIPGYFISDFQVYALDNLRIKLPLLLLPLGFAFKKELEPKQVQIILKCFWYACFLMAFLVASNFMYVWFKSGEILMGNKPLEFTVIHRSYLSIFLALAGFFSITRPLKMKLNRHLKHLGLLFFTIAVIIIASRLGIIWMILVLMFIPSRYLKGKKRLAFAALILMLMLITVTQVNFIQSRFDKFMSSITKPNAEMNTQEVDDRIIIWKNSWTLIKERPVLGYGTGDYKEEHLRQQHNISGFGKGYRNHYNAHNQFFENWLATGIVGFALLVIYFLYLFKWSLLGKNKTLFFFAFLTLSFLLVESALQTQSGNMYLLFFSFLLLHTVFFESHFANKQHKR